MNRIFRFFACAGLLLATLATPSDSAAQSDLRGDRQDHQTLDENSDSDSIVAALKELSDVKFARRRAAFRRLVAMGNDAIAALEQAAGGDDLNVAEHCVKALAEISFDPDCTETAFAALDRLASDETSRIAKFAALEYKRLKMSDMDRAIAALESAGIQIRPNPAGEVFMITILRDQDLFWLKFLPKLRYVSLMRGQITDQGIDHLVECDQVQSLSFYDTAVTDVGLAKLSKLDSLTSLSMSGAKVTADGIRSLRKVSKLRSLSWRSEISEDQLRAFGDLPQLSTLSLSGVEITNEGVQVINGLDQLTRLSLSLTGVQDFHCVRLSQLNVASSLSIMRSPGLTAKGWKNLSEMNLQSLMVYYTPLTDDEMPYIGAVTSLTTLAITEAPITDEGLDQLKTLTNLRYLNLRNTNVTEEGGDRLKNVLPKLSRVRINSSNLPGAVPAAPPIPYSITGTADERHVHLRTAVTDEIVEKLKKESNIHTVFMMRNNFKDGDVKLIAKLPIERLVIDSDEVTDDGLATLKGHAHLTSLTITSNRVSDACSDALVGIPNLDSLWICESTLTDKGARTLIKGVGEKSQIAHLSLNNCPNLTDSAFTEISKLKSLETLIIIESPNVTRGVLPFIAKLDKLKSLHLDGIEVDAADLMHLSPLDLKSLDLSNSKINAGAIAALVESCPRLIRLALAGSSVTDVEMPSIGKLSQLENLILNDTQIGDAGLEMLGDLKHLKSVHVNASAVTQTAQQRFRQQHPGVRLGLAN